MHSAPLSRVGCALPRTLGAINTLYKKLAMSGAFIIGAQHGSKEMVDRVYGHYREGLEEDAISILEYFGPDFVEEERKLAARLLTLRCESFAKVSNPASLTA